MCQREREKIEQVKDKKSFNVLNSRGSSSLRQLIDRGHISAHAFFNSKLSLYYLLLRRHGTFHTMSSG